MNKTIALTFTAAVVLVLASVATSIYGHHLVESQRAAEAEEGLSKFTMYDCYGYDPQLQSWDRAAGVMGLMALSVSIAGGMLWDRETRPQTEQRSVLGLEGRAAGRIAGTTALRKSVVSEETHADSSSTWPSEAESLTPLERVIRGY